MNRQISKNISNALYLFLSHQISLKHWSMEICLMYVASIISWMLWLKLKYPSCLLSSHSFCSALKAKLYKSTLKWELTKSFLASEISHMNSSEETLTQHTVFTYFRGDIVCVGSYLCLLYPGASEARTTFLKHLISCPHLRGGKKKRKKCIFQHAYQLYTAKQWRSLRNM